MHRAAIETVRKTWRMVALQAPDVGYRFYENLFAAAPELRSLFPTDIYDQGNKLVQTLAVAVEGLDNIESVTPILQDLGKGHSKYQVTQAHFDLVGQTLLKTLEQSLGAGFNTQAHQAWSEIYGAVAKVMLDAASSDNVH